MIHLEDIDGSNWRIPLRVAKGQETYVSDSMRLLARAYAYREANSHAFLVYEDAVPVGMGLYHDYEPWSAYDFSQLFIDARYQGKGCGKAAVAEVLRRMKKENRFHKAILCYIEGNDAAKRLYEGFGFRETGERDGDEIVMVLEW